MPTVSECVKLRLSGHYYYCSVIFDTLESEKLSMRASRASFTKSETGCKIV